MNPLSRYYCVLYVDRGFSHWPHQIDHGDMNSFEEWCKEHYVVFVAPDPKNWKPEWVFQFDKVTKKLYKKPLCEIEFGRESIIMNHMRLELKISFIDATWFI